MGEDQRNEGIGQANTAAYQKDERRSTGQARGDCEGTLEEGKGSWEDSSITSARSPRRDAPCRV